MGDCIYDRVIAIYSRTQQVNLLRCFGKHSHLVHSKWTAVQQQLYPQVFNSYRLLCNIVLDDGCFPTRKGNVHELRVPDSTLIVGIILCSAGIESSMGLFDEYFAHILLQHTAKLTHYLEPTIDIGTTSTVATIVDLCNRELLFHPPNSQWEVVGRSYFLQKISFFTSRRLPIQMCLPAFPCKSSNLEKVAVALPDRGEELALRRLYSVLRQIELIYEPGARICIISDGHVFSDCSK